MSRLQPACSLPAASLQPSCSLSQASLQPPDSLLEGACYPVLSQTIGREQRDTVAGRRRGGVVRGDDGGSATDCPACMQPVLSLLPACARTVPSVPPACFQRVLRLHTACSLSDEMLAACFKATSRPPPAYMSVLVAHCGRLTTHHVEVQRACWWGAWTVLVAHGKRLTTHHIEVQRVCLLGA